MKDPLFALLSLNIICSVSRKRKIAKEYFDTHIKTYEMISHSVIYPIPDNKITNIQRNISDIKYGL